MHLEPPGEYDKNSAVSLNCEKRFGAICQNKTAVFTLVKLGGPNVEVSPVRHTSTVISLISVRVSESRAVHTVRVSGEESVKEGRRRDKP